jgi:hypothetical protein|nr:MAG TPA: Protein of unknown function (DUF3789) [Caudoviricetes sp.]
MFKFLIGLFIGLVTGVFILALLIASKKQDEFEEYMKDDKYYYDDK